MTVHQLASYLLQIVDKKSVRCAKCRNWNASIKDVSEDLKIFLHMNLLSVPHEQKHFKPSLFVLEFNNDIVRHLEMIFISYIYSFA